MFGRSNASPSRDRPMTQHSLSESRTHVLQRRPLLASPASRSDVSMPHRGGKEPSIVPHPVADVTAPNEWDEWKSVRDVG